MSGILAKILAHKATEVAAAKARTPEAVLHAQARAVSPARDFAAALRPTGHPRPRVIAEVKRASPSAGQIRPGADAAAIAAGYEAHGAAAISCLTDERFFGGTLADLAAVKAAVSIPVLRKDFTIDPYQIVEARAAGADAILLIVAAFAPDDGDARLRELFAAAQDVGVHVLVEVHDAPELERAVALGATIIGVNHRDLRTFTMDLELSARLRPLAPAGAIFVGESGLKTPADVARVHAAGCDAILVGESLMRAPDPGAALAELLA